MQDNQSITFDPIPAQTPVLHTWEIVVAVFLFSVLIGYAGWRSRRNSRVNRGTLNLSGKRDSAD